MKSFFQLNCLFAEINVQRLLIKNFKNEKNVFGGHIVFLHYGGRGHIAALLTLKSKWFATLEIMMNIVALMFFPTHEKTPYEQGEYPTVIRLSR